MTLALAVLVASLVGSPHCAAMCGGFVCFYAGGGRWGKRESGAAAHLAYNGGRLVSYTMLGAMAGAAGAGLDAAGRMAGWSRLAAVVAGGLMVAWGLARLSAMGGVRLPMPTAPGRVRDAVRSTLGALLQRAGDRPPVVRAAATGLLTTLLPCGWLYAFVVTAAAAGSAAGGALVMAAFWAGTLPMMVAVGVGVQRLAGPLASRLPAVSAVFLVALGLLSIAGRLRPGSLLHGDHPAEQHQVAPSPATVSDSLAVVYSGGVPEQRAHVSR